jgi:aspartate/methionine/tyrosine aminotransferase
VLGDPALIASLLEARKHLGLMMPAPVQAAAAAALSDDLHVAEQRHRYARRRDHLLSALLDAGLSIEHSEAGLYLWATRGESCWDTVAWLAEHGILVAPGEFYGAAGSQHVRVALTATDERVAAAVRRLARAA